MTEIRLLMARRGLDRWGQEWPLDELVGQLNELPTTSRVVTFGFNPAQPVGMFKSAELTSEGLFAIIDLGDDALRDSPHELRASYAAIQPMASEVDPVGNSRIVQVSILEASRSLWP